MVTGNEEQEQPQESNTFTVLLLKTIAILFVVGIYAVIFLKILFLK